MLLRELRLHARGGGFEEESDKMLVCAICTDLFEGGNVGSAIFEQDDEQRMISTKEDKVREQAARSAVTITERMQIFEISVPFSCYD